MKKSRKVVKRTNNIPKKTNKLNRSYKSKHKKLTLGGKAVDSGGYGCIFMPQLESYNCQGHASVSNDKELYISKLMLKSDAEDEYKNNQRINEIMERGDKRIFKYVFTNDTSLCQVRRMIGEDLNGFSTHCKKLKSSGYNFNDYNPSDVSPDRLRKLRVINSPNGGNNLYFIFNFLRENLQLELNKQFCISYSEKMKSVYENAIYLFYRLSPKIIHGDMKEENLICKFSKSPPTISGNIKVIDWGLSYLYDPSTPGNNNTNLMSAITQIARRPYQFNLPFSIILYDTTFQQIYKQRVLDYLNSLPPNSRVNQKQLIEEFCNSYFNNQYFFETRKGERKYILDDFNKSIFVVIKRVFPDIQLSLEDYVRKYLVTILNKYTYATNRQLSSTFSLSRERVTNTQWKFAFHIDLFSSEIYLPMTDSYGFFLTYGSLLSYLLFKNLNSTTNTITGNSLSHNSGYQTYIGNSPYKSIMKGGNNIRDINTLTSICKFIANKIITQCLVFDPSITGEDYRRNTLNYTREIHNQILTLNNIN